MDVTGVNVSLKFFSINGSGNESSVKLCHSAAFKCIVILLSLLSVALSVDSLLSQIL